MARATAHPEAADSEVAPVVATTRINTGQIQAREAKVADLAVERLDQLTDFFIAVRDKDRPAEFEAGLRGRKRRKLTGAAAAQQAKEATLPGLDEFRKRYNNAQALQEIDLSLPPLSPSPPPTQPPISAAGSATVAMVDIVNDSDEDADAEGEEEDEEMAVAESLAPPGVSVTTTSGTSTGAALVKDLHLASNASASPVASTSRLTAPSPSTADLVKSASPSAQLVATPPSVTPQPSQATINPSLLAAPGAPSTVQSASSPQSPIPPPPPYVPPEPYHSLFGIHEISTDYPENLPPVPQDILRNRLNTALMLRANTKKSSRSSSAAAPLVQPDLYKLHVKSQHMGARSFLGPGKRVHNALTTHEWEVGVDEMRATRAFERIEQLKGEKKWSFRQPKKQRVGVVPKAHWDHVLDEMRWMHIDFRQERRWKVVTAHNLARACRTWHRASPEKRPSMCVRTRPPRFLTDEEIEARLHEEDGEGEAMEVEEKAQKAKKLDKGKGKQREEDAVEEDADAEGEEDADGEEDDSTPATAGEGAAVFTSTSATPAPSTASVPVANAPRGAGKAGGSTGNEATPGPPAGTLSRAQAAALEAQRAHAEARQTFNIISFRNPIFDLSSEETIVDPLTLAALREASLAAAAAVTDGDRKSPSSSPPAADDSLLSHTFATLFPDLPAFSDFVVAQDPSLDRRIEDSSAWAGRLAHVTRLLESKPLLVSTLQPGRTRTKQGWTPGTAAALEDIRDPVDPRETVPATASALFAGRKPKDASSGEVLVRADPVPHADVRATTLLWLPEEDAKLLALQKQYGFNWSLIAQIFNLSTHRPSSDHRLPWDCYDRWDRLVGPGSKKTLPDGTEIVKQPPEWIPPLDPLTGRPFPIIGDGSKKKARHVTILEAMKKVQKKREASAAKQPPPGFPRRINMSMHESHNLPPRPNWTPLEWNLYKSEQEQQKARLRQQQALAQQQAQQQQQQQQQQPNGGRFPQQQPGVPQGNFPAPPGQQPPRLASSLPPQMAAAQAAARGSPNGSPASLPPPPLGNSPSPAQLQQQLPNGTSPLPLSLPNGIGVPGQTPQLTPEQLQMLQQRQRELMAAQAQRAAAQAQAAATQAAQQNGAAGGDAV
ncbi:hypothetical protein JCM11251_003891 [Rhodosporidiobolus azoricus]